MDKRALAIIIVPLFSLALLIALFAGLQGPMGRLQPVLGAPADVITPTLTALNPSSSYNDIDTHIVISGTGFSAEMSGTLVLTVPTAYLGSTALEDVTWVSETALNAVVPWGMVPGVYTLTVTNPGGGTATLPEAFTVTNGIGVFTTDGPFGGSILEVHQKPDTPDTLYTLVHEIGVFTSLDAGDNWELINPDTTVFGMNLTFDAVNPDVIYKGSNDTHAARTLDGGQTWEPLLPEPNNYCEDLYLAAHPTEAGVIYAGIGNCLGLPVPPEGLGVFRSDDYGVTWVPKNSDLTNTNVHAIGINPVDPLIMLAGTIDGDLFYSEDGGEHWTFSASLGAPIKLINFNPYVNAQAWVFTRMDAENFLYVSTNLTDWELVNLFVSASPSIQMDFLPESVWVASGSLNYTTDDGANWDEISGLHGVASALDVLTDQPGLLYAGTDMGMEKSIDDGASWQEINQGLAGLVPIALAASPADMQTVYVKAYQDIFRSFNGGSTWQALQHGKGGNARFNLKVDPYAPNRVYYGIRCLDAFCLDVSTDYGETWNVITATVPITTASYTYGVSAVAPHPMIPGRILAGVSVNFTNFDPWEKSLGFVYSSDDYGQTWTWVELDMPLNWVEEIVFDAVDPDLIYMATQGTGLWKSMDGGATWNPTPFPQAYSRATDIDTHPTFSGHIILVAQDEFQQGDIYASQDAGETWTELNGGGDPLIYAPTWIPTLYAFSGVADAYGLGRSLDEGRTWDIVEGAPWPDSLAVSSDGERVVLYLGSRGSLATALDVSDATSSLETVHSELTGGGVYRLTTLLPDNWLYLPLVVRMTAP